jgi:RHS repeat-associated protein
VLTNNAGSYHERIEYLPYGETWVEDKATSDSYTTPYKFTSKELDAETGLYYFGARYYDARISRWISADPALAEGKYFPKPNDYDTEHDFYWYLQQDGSKKLAGLGGVFNAVNMDVYHYAGDNPVKLVDPDGNDIILLNKSYGAIGHGHNGVLIGNDKNGWFYFSKDGPGKLNQNAKYFKSLSDFIKANLKDNNGLNNYDRAYRVETSEDEDSKMIEEGFNIYDRDYSFVEKLDNEGNAISQNCADLVADILEVIGLNIGKPKMDTPVGDVTKPNYQFENFIKSNKGELIDILRQLPPKG